MRVLVTGSRNLKDREKVYGVLNTVWQHRGQPDIFVGDCPTGADKYARDYAEMHGIGLVVFKADWNAHGKAAGPKRNQELVDSEPDLVLAFPQGESRGTNDCIRRAKKAGLNVLIYETEEA